MGDRPFFPIPLRPGAIALTLGGMILIAANGARGPGSLLGFGLFGLGIAALDAIHRRSVGFRHASILLGILAAGLGLWSALATGLLVLLALPVPPELRSLLVASAACAAGSVASALLAVRSPVWLRAGSIWAWLRRASKRRLVGFNRPDEPRRDRSFDAGQPLRRAGPVRGG